MNLKNLIIERRTIHQFRNEPVSQDILHSMFETAIYAPNHKLTFPWKFYRLQRESRKQLGALAAKIKLSAEGKTASPALITASEEKFLNCAELIVLALIKSGKPAQEKEDYASMACAVQNMSLFLWDKGIGSKWSTGKVTTDVQTYELLKVDPKNQEIVGFFWIGFPKEIPKAPPRPPISNFIINV